MPGVAEDGAVVQKKSLIAREQLRADVIERRRNFAIARRFVDPQSFVFLDESGAQSNMTRLYGRAPIGERCVDHIPHGHWKTTTLLSAIRLDGVIESATVIYDGPMNRVTFEGYAEQYLAPSLRPGDVVVMDNLASHKSAAVVDAIESADATVWYLPPYSPDLNPIEKLWSQVKTWLRRVAARTFKAIGKALVEVLQTVDSTECANYMRSCGYEIR